MDKFKGALKGLLVLPARDISMPLWPANILINARSAYCKIDIVLSLILATYLSKEWSLSILKNDHIQYFEPRL